MPATQSPGSKLALPDAPLHVWNFLTRDELILCLSLVMATKAEETYLAYPLYDYVTPGEERMTDDWTELTLRAIRYLAFVHGLRFSGIAVHSSGSVTAEKPICPQNSIMVALFRVGGFPDFDILIPQAIATARARVPNLDVEPMRAIAGFLEAEIEDRIRNSDPQLLHEQAQLRVAAMQAAAEPLSTMFQIPAESRELLGPATGNSDYEN